MGENGENGKRHNFPMGKNGVGPPKSYVYCIYYIHVSIGGSNPIFAHGKMCVFPFFPIGKNGKKVYGKKGKNIHFPLFPYTFLPMG